MLDTRRERNIIAVINDDDVRRWGKGLHIINISVCQGFINNLQGVVSGIVGVRGSVDPEVGRWGT